MGSAESSASTGFMVKDFESFESCFLGVCFVSKFDIINQSEIL